MSEQSGVNPVVAESLGFDGIRSSELSDSGELTEVTRLTERKGRNRFQVVGDWVGEHQKVGLRIAVAGLGLLAAGYLFTEAVLNKTPANPFLAAPAPTETKAAFSTKITKEGVLVQTASPTKQPATETPQKATPTEQKATATPKKEATPTTQPVTPTEKPAVPTKQPAIPTSAPKEPTPTIAPVKSSSMPLEIPYEKGKTIDISAKEVITPGNFDKYFEPVSDEKALGKLLDVQGRPLYPEFEELVQIKKEILTYGGSVTLRAPADVKKILNWDEYQDLLDRYIFGSPPQTPINYIAYTKPGELELRFIIGRIDSKGRLELVVRAPLEAEKAMTYHRKVGDSVERLTKLVTIGEHKGGKIIEFVLPANSVASFLRGTTKEMEGSLHGGVTFADDPRYFAQINDKAAVPATPSVK